VVLNFAESPNIHFLDPLHVFQLPHLQTVAQGAIWTSHTYHKWNQNWQWFDRSSCSDCHGFRLPFLGISFVAANETSIEVKNIQGKVLYICMKSGFKWSLTCRQYRVPIDWNFWPFFGQSYVYCISFSMFKCNNACMLAL